MSTAFAAEEVAAYEHATWSRCAPTYRDGFAALTAEAIPPLLAFVRPGTRLLDIGTGTGIVAAAARQLGASVIGIDFSDSMLAEARRSVPDVDFRTASADALPFDDGSFDALVGNVVLHHLGRPAAALAEAHRVLTPGGRVACTVWAGMETLAAFGVFFAAVEEHAAGAELPHGPLFGVADESTLSSLFTDAGFTDVTVETVETSWRMPSIEPLLQAFGAWAQLDTFPATIRGSIETSVRSAATAYVTDDGLVIPNPMLLITGVKPGRATSRSEPHTGDPMRQPRPALITPRDLTRTETDGVLTEKALDGERIPAPELVFGRFVIEPGIDLAPHVHSADTIAYCIRGTCSFRTGENLDEGFEMGPGDYAYIPAGTVHTESTGSDGVELVFARDHRGGETRFVDEETR